MRNTWLIIRREYLERVRTKSFIVTTLLIPTLMGGIILVPAKLATLKSGGSRHIVVVASDSGFADTVKKQLETTTADGPKRSVDIDLQPTEAERDVLRTAVGAGKIDGYLWLSDENLKARQITYSAREVSDIGESVALQSAVNRAIIKQNLAGKGISASEVDELMRGVKLDTIAIKGGKESKTNSLVQFLSSIVLVMMLYMTLLLYGVAVMRSVLEEKTSRVIEVMLSSVTAKELMAGKVIGVGAVGITQVLIWGVLSLVITSPQMMAARAAVPELGIPAVAIPAFGIFFVLGFLLYSAMFAALGAMVNSEQEAQQWQFFVTMPIIFAAVLMSPVIQHPSSPLAFWSSLVPFFAPLLMYLRIVVQTPPWWQIGLCVGLMVATVYAMLALCSRIYRVGILMYGKKPTLPEILKWVRYA